MTDIQTFRSVVSEMIKRSPYIVIVSKITIAYRNGYHLSKQIIIISDNSATYEKVDHHNKDQENKVT